MIILEIARAFSIVFKLTINEFLTAPMRISASKERIAEIERPLRASKFV